MTHRASKNWDPGQSFAGLIILLGNYFSKESKRFLTKNGLRDLSLPKVLILNSVSRRPHKQAELAALLKQEPASITEILADMQSNDLVKWKEDSIDRRVKMWTTTRKGEAVREKCEALFRKSGKLLDDYFEAMSISQNDLNTIKSSLQKIYANLGSRYE